MSERKPIEVTEEMLRAGSGPLCDYVCGVGFDMDETLRQIFVAMISKSPDVDPQQR